MPHFLITYKKWFCWDTNNLLISLFLDNGKIIKAINAVSYDSNKRAVPVVIEELQAFAAGSPVRALRVARAGRDAARLIAVSDRQVLSLRLHRCSSDKISSCRYL